MGRGGLLAKDNFQPLFGVGRGDGNPQPRQETIDVPPHQLELLQLITSPEYELNRRLGFALETFRDIYKKRVYPQDNEKHLRPTMPQLRKEVKQLVAHNVLRLIRSKGRSNGYKINSFSRWSEDYQLAWFMSSGGKLPHAFNRWEESGERAAFLASMEALGF